MLEMSDAADFSPFSNVSASVSVIKNHKNTEKSWLKEIQWQNIKHQKKKKR